MNYDMCSDIFTSNDMLHANYQESSTILWKSIVLHKMKKRITSRYLIRAARAAIACVFSISPDEKM